MGDLRKKIDEQLKKKGQVDLYKENSLYFYEKYQRSDNEVQSVGLENIQFGRFYFFHYRDDSKWIQYSPVFTIDFKKFENLIIIRAVNLNLIPLEIRTEFFDRFIVSKDMEQDKFLQADFTTTYNELLQVGFEYAIMEYNMAQMVLAHRINMSIADKFIYAGHPINKYDPKKLYDIWKVKIENKYQRNQEMSISSMKDFYDVSEQIDSKYEVLKSHIKRLQSSLMKYGR